MSVNNRKLLLKFHCDQDIDAMPLKENDTQRYCEKCDRNLVDFRNHSMEEVLQYKKTLQGEKICGIFPSQYIQPEIIIQPRFESRKSIFSNSLMVLAAFSMLTACQTESSSVKTSTDKEIEQPKENDTHKPAKKKDCTNDSTKNPIPPKIKIIDDIMPEPPPFVGIEMDPEPIYETVYEENEQQADEILSFAEKMPEFPGGEAKMMEFVKKEIRYPEFAKEQGMEGTVYIRFVINENGDVINPTILKTPNKIFDEPSLSVIRRMPKWTPGENSGKKVKVYITLPIRYKLNN